MRRVRLWAMDEEVQLPTKLPKWRRFVDRRLPAVVIFLMVTTLVALVFYPQIVMTVPTGHVGVLWKRFQNGTVLDPRELKDEGLHLILPWDKLFLYDLRIKSIGETYGAISLDGVAMAVSLNIRYRLKRDTIPTLHQVIGPEYLKLVGPGIASHMREVVSQHPAEVVYSTGRNEIQEKIRQLTVNSLGDKMMEGEGPTSYSVAMREAVTIYDTLLYGIELPPAVVAAINRKAEQYYISEEYKFRVEREKRESERKRIEAVGIRDFQHTVSQGISDSYLRWRGIEATFDLSQSTNSKVVIIGSGKDKLPIILGNVDTPVPTKDGSTPFAEDVNVPQNLSIGSPALPTEKIGLAKPSDKIPIATTAPGQPHSFGPFRFPVIEALLYWILRPAEHKAETLSVTPAEIPVRAQP